MIFPFLKGIRGFELAPITWMIVGLNVMIFMIMLPQQYFLHQKLENHLNDVRMQKTQSQVYLQYLRDKESLTSAQIKLIRQADARAEVWPQALSLSLGDAQFLAAAEGLSPIGDQVAVQGWKRWIKEFRYDNELRPLTAYGVSAVDSSWSNMLTYQYLHANSLHLLTNMLVLLIFGSLLESLLGSFFFILIYTISGIAGAFAFVHFNGLGVAPMVGASAAISGIIAFYAVFEERRRICFAYFLGPVQGYYGLIYLPTWVIFPVCFLSDIASLLQSSGSLGSVAYAAHIGGGAMGLILALALKPVFVLARGKASA